MSNPWDDPNATRPAGVTPPPPAGPQPPDPQQPGPPPGAPQYPAAPQYPTEPQYPAAPPQPTTPPPPAGSPYYATAPTPPPGPPGPPPAPPASSGGGGGKGGKIAAGAIGLLLLGGGGAFALANMSSDSGPSSPEAAVEEVLRAADSEDVLGLLGAIDPGERDAVLDNVERVFGELERLEVLDSSFEASGIDGIDLTIDFDSVEYDTTEIREGLVRVEITDGDIDYSVDPAELPVGDLITDLAGDVDDQDPQEGSTSFSDSEDPIYLVARDTGSDGWRVSVGYTFAEYARVDAGEPDLDDPIEPIGEDSPEAAVEEFLRAFEGDSLDPEELIARLSPSEFRALHEYLPTFVGRDGLAVEEYGNVEITFAELELSADTTGDRALVAVDAFEVVVDETDLDETIRVDWDGECLSIDASDAPSAQEELEESGFGDEICAGEPLDFDQFGEMLPEPPDFGDLEFGTFGIATARVDGQWYVAPIDTSLQSVVTTLEALDRQIIEDTVDYVGELFGSFFLGGFDDMVESSSGVEFPDDGPFGDPNEIDPFEDEDDEEASAPSTTATTAPSGEPTGGEPPTGGPEFEWTGDCSEVDGPCRYGDDPTFDRLWDQCAADGAQACDDLFFDSPSGSQYEEFGNSCGGRGFEFSCAETYG